MNMSTVSQTNVIPFVCGSTEEVGGQGRRQIDRGNIEFVLVLLLKRTQWLLFIKIAGTSDQEMAYTNSRFHFHYCFIICL